ncbi:hypothetical protein GCK72_000543 [Caenorhabditis remanei]|uniref:TIL domain-containing protein n=1 Tax=Caenorhabditis remanei TaxID=31234 RepID=A0A6A5HKM5_CAERE|nr:hypothetical protein GCK72_000543 [Caenorhabditis remanei]KAF1768730.1 hypothetical protein GCK72_000543 [Caenorhabditis remanei]
MQFSVFYLISLLLVLAVFIEARDSDIDDEAYETEKVSYCPRFEKWHRCGNGCEKSCTHPKQPSAAKCKLPCIPYSCRCKLGYYRDNQGTGRCVRRNKCKKW